MHSQFFPSIMFVGVHMEALAPFTYLVESGCCVRGLVTLRPESMAKVSGAVDLVEIAHNTQIPVLRVRNINEPEAIEWIRAQAPDLLLVVGWTQLVNDDLLRVPKLAAIGFHASLLPKSRGRAPVNWSLINGDRVTGNTMIILEPGADSGDIIDQRTIAITDEDDCKTVYEKVGETEVDMLRKTLPMIRKGILPRRKQDDSQVTVMPRRRPEDGIITWNRMNREIYNWIRALTEPYPGAFSFLDGEKVWIWKAAIDGQPDENRHGQPGEVTLDSQGWPWVATADGWIRLITIQRDGLPKVSGQVAAATFLHAGNKFGGLVEVPK
jgi:methionyl-tRNA formyltransferase